MNLTFFLIDQLLFNQDWLVTMQSNGDALPAKHQGCMRTWLSVGTSSTSVYNWRDVNFLFSLIFFFIE
jgi:hypothetical protein